MNNGGAAFLLVPVGARAAALGQASGADAGTSEAAFWNPAGLSTMTSSELALHHTHTFASDNYAVAFYLATRRLGALGVAAYLVDYGAQDVVPGPDQPTVGSIDPRNVELIASYAAPIGGGLSFGVNYKIVQFRQDCTGACGQFESLVGTTHAVDVGVQYALAGDALRLGATVRHAGFPLQVENRDQADPLPTQVVFGAIYRMFLPGPSDVDRMDARVLLDLRDDWGQYGDPDVHLGL
ncbi:MAG TPA: PorV/PorQ family protein, partial [Gemmatimonadales bacterium]